MKLSVPLPALISFCTVFRMSSAGDRVGFSAALDQTAKDTNAGSKQACRRIREILCPKKNISCQYYNLNVGVPGIAVGLPWAGRSAIV